MSPGSSFGLFSFQKVRKVTGTSLRERNVTSWKAQGEKLQPCRYDNKRLQIFYIVKKSNFLYALVRQSSLEEYPNFGTNVGHNSCAYGQQLGILHVVNRITILHGQRSSFQPEICKLDQAILLGLNRINISRFRMDYYLLYPTSSCG